MNTNRKHAIIIGGSIAGLVSADVLAGHFDRVTIIERDVLPDAPAARPGTPQAHHIHVLLLKGQYTLERLFPGFQDDLAAMGAPAMDWTADCLWIAEGQPAPRYASGLVTHFASRDLLEYAIRRRLQQNPRIEFYTGREAVALIPNADHTRATRVQLRPRGQLVSTEELSADLIVDASGRESRLPQWLEQLGYEPPAETRVNSFLGYASRIYRQPPAPRDWQAVLVRPTPPGSSRGGGIMPMEGNRWIANLGSAGRDYPPTDEPGFLEFARSLSNPILYDALREAEPLTSIYGYRRTENRLRHYERLARLPENVIALGDAVCAFNPVYGQGMTVAALGAVTLDECLHKHPDEGFALKFQARLARANELPWAMATSVDFLYPGTESNMERHENRLVNAYLARVSETSFRDPYVNLAFLKVIHLLEPPSVWFRPGIARRVLQSALRHRSAVPEQLHEDSRKLTATAR